MRFNGTVSLISLVGFLFQEVSWCSQLLPTLFCDQLEGKAKWFKTAGVYYIVFKVPTGRVEIGDPLDMYSVNCDISPNLPLFRKGGKKVRLLSLGGGGKDCELDLESCALVGGQIMR